MLTWLCIVACALGLASGARGGSKEEEDVAEPGAAVTHHSPVEAHHSLHHPFDISLPYWRYGGSTVATESFVRLTPNSQSRTGWIFNEFELRSGDWEVELHFAVSSTFHIGGDGFGFFVLNDTMHPRKFKHHNSLAGGVFGMRDDFEGFGVIFDTYDNDGARDNPSVFAIKQTPDEKQKWNHDTDFQENMLKTSASGLDYECASDYRNNPTTVNTIFRYIDQTLHVYMNTKGVYTFCLSVNVGIDTTNMNFALAALTGQVADSHDIFMLSTRYLSDKDAKIDDRLLKRTGYRGRSVSISRILYWLTNIALIVIAAFVVIQEYWQFSRLKSDKLNPTVLCQNLNPLILVGYATHLGFLAMVVLSGQWTLVIINLPFILWRANAVMVESVRLEPIKIRKLRGYFDIGQIFGTVFKLLTLLVTLIVCFIKLFS